MRGFGGVEKCDCNNLAEWKCNDCGSLFCEKCMGVYSESCLICNNCASFDYEEIQKYPEFTQTNTVEIERKIKKTDKWVD